MDFEYGKTLIAWSGDVEKGKELFADDRVQILSEFVLFSPDKKESLVIDYPELERHIEETDQKMFNPILELLGHYDPHIEFKAQGITFDLGRDTITESTEVLLKANIDILQDKKDITDDIKGVIKRAIDIEMTHKLVCFLESLIEQGHNLDKKVFEQMFEHVKTTA